MTARDKTHTARHSDTDRRPDTQTQTDRWRQRHIERAVPSSMVQPGIRATAPPSAPPSPRPCTLAEHTTAASSAALCPLRTPSRGPLSGRRRELGNRSEPFLALVWRQREANKRRNVKNTSRNEDRITLLPGRYW